MQAASSLLANAKVRLSQETRQLRKMKRHNAQQACLSTINALQIQVADLKSQIQAWHTWYYHRSWQDPITTLEVPTVIAARVCAQAASTELHHKACAQAGRDIHYARNSTKDHSILQVHKRANAAKHDALYADPWWIGSSSSSLMDPWAKPVERTSMVQASAKVLQRSRDVAWASSVPTKQKAPCLNETENIEKDMDEEKSLEAASEEQEATVEGDLFQHDGSSLLSSGLMFDTPEPFRFSLGTAMAEHKTTETDSDDSDGPPPRSLWTGKRHNRRIANVISLAERIHFDSYPIGAVAAPPVVPDSTLSCYRQRARNKFAMYIGELIAGELEQTLFKDLDSKMYKYKCLAFIINLKTRPRLVLALKSGKTTLQQVTEMDFTKSDDELGL